MRTLIWLWIAFLLLCFLLDAASYFLVRMRLDRALDLALDGALTAGISEEDLMWGRPLLRQDRAAAAAKKLLEENLGPYLARRTDTEIFLEQEGEGLAAQGRLKARLPLLLAGFLGREGQIYISKTLAYQGVYH